MEESSLPHEYQEAETGLEVLGKLLPRAPI